MSFDDFLDDQESLEDEPLSKTKESIDLYKSIDDYRQMLAQEYLKVGMFCKMTPSQYLDEVPWMIEAISDEIDTRLKPYIDAAQERLDDLTDGKAKSPLNYEHLALLLFGASLFGGGEDT